MECVNKYLDEWIGAWKNNRTSDWNKRIWVFIFRGKQKGSGPRLFQVRHQGKTGLLNKKG
jgi:hypothetical protein